MQTNQYQFPGVVGYSPMKSKTKQLMVIMSLAEENLSTLFLTFRFKTGTRKKINENTWL